ncbi:MAG: arginine--tRNA ligase [Thermoplasmata archaeon]|nr:arginine--tRNA ligase [Thermoplasmata archaeon]MBR4685829.1 arginine--tRNA ligase [Candidatus Methanomethylophilaceae archaeon]
MTVMDDFRSEIQEKVSAALKDMGSEGAEFVIEASTMEGVDMAVPCFPLAKAMRKAPQMISDDLASRIQPSGMISKVSSVNGFLNFNIDPSALIRSTLDEIVRCQSCYGSMPSSGITVNVEHTSTNPTGPIHVGRARNPIIGDTLARCLKRCGHKVTTEYYVNDVGKQVVVLTWGVNNVSDEEAAKNSEEHMKEIGQNEKERDKTDHRLVAKYRVANKRMESDPAVQEEIADMMRRFEQGDKEVIDTVRHTAEIMLDGLRETLGNINVVLDRYTWESQYIADGSARDVVEKLKKSKYAGQTEDGAWFVDLKDFGVQGKNTKFTFTRSDGTTLYTTRDLAYHLDKFTRADRLIDVLGEDQKLGSKQLCSALEILGNEKLPEPLFYAFVSLPEGKMSTRKGVVVYLDDLIDEAVARAYEEIKSRRKEMPEDRMREIAKIVGVAAVRFNIIRVQPEKQFVFKWEDALNFDGNSGPYLQYVHARACTMLKKAGEFEHDTDPAKFVEPTELNLIKTLARYEDVLKTAGNDMRVHMLPAYGHELASAFNQYYADVSILNSNEKRNARLTLVECAKTVLADVLDCLGMGAPEEM